MENVYFPVNESIFTVEGSIKKTLKTKLVNMFNFNK